MMKRDHDDMMATSCSCSRDLNKRQRTLDFDVPLQPSIAVEEAEDDEDLPLILLKRSSGSSSGGDTKHQRTLDFVAPSAAKPPQYVQDLREKGYAIIEDVLSADEVAAIKQDFYGWLDSSEQIKRLHPKIDPHGIFKFVQVCASHVSSQSI